MIVRREQPADIAMIRAVTARAFARLDAPTPAEATLVDELRADPGWISELSLVADSDGVVGHVTCTRASVGSVAALGLGPLSVDPPYQAMGVGSALVHAVLGAADARDEPMVVLLGSPDYYCRFGFVLAATLGITPPVPEWAPDFQVRTLAAYEPTMRGEFRYAAPFERL